MKVAQGVADGSVTLAFRRWKKQDVRPGQEFVTAAGMVRVDDVTVVDADAITDDEARLAGWPDAARLRKRLNPDESLPTYRVRLSHAGRRPAGRAAGVGRAQPRRRRRPGPPARAAGPGQQPRAVDPRTTWS